MRASKVKGCIQNYLPSQDNCHILTILGVSLTWKNACIVRKCVVESEGSTLLCGLYCDGLVSELLGSNEMTKGSPVRDGRTPNLVESRVIWVSLSMRDWSGKRLLRGSRTRRLRSLKTLTESRRQITLSVLMMAKEIKMLLSTT